MLKPVAAQLAYPFTLVTLFSRFLLTHLDIDLLIRENCTDEYNQVLIKAGLRHLISDDKGKNLCLYASEKMEDLFLNQFIKQSVSIVRAFSGAERELLIYWLRQIEIANIKTILRGKSMHRDDKSIQAQLFNPGPLTGLPINELLQAEDVPEVLRLLENTRYASLAYYTLSRYEQHKEIFGLETSVDQQFFIGLLRRFNTQTAENQKKLNPLLGRIIDQINLVRLLRYRINYGLSPSHTYFLLSSGGYRLKQQELLNLVKIQHIENILEQLPLFLSNRLSGRLNGPQKSIQLINSVMEQDVINYAQQVLRKETFSLTSVLAFLIIRRQQLSLIHSILKGKSMHLDEKTIRFAIGWN